MDATQKESRALNHQQPADYGSMSNQKPEEESDHEEKEVEEVEEADSAHRGNDSSRSEAFAVPDTDSEDGEEFKTTPSESLSSIEEEKDKVISHGMKMETIDIRLIIAKIDSAIAILENKIESMKAAAYCGSNLCCTECKSISSCGCSVYLMSVACWFWGFNPIAGLLTCFPAAMLGVTAYKEAVKAVRSHHSNAYWEKMLGALPVDETFRDSQKYLQVLETLAAVGFDADNPINSNVIFLKQLWQLRGRKLELVNSGARILEKKSFFNDWVRSDLQGDKISFTRLTHRLNEIRKKRIAASEAGDVEEENALYLNEQQLAISYYAHEAMEAEDRLNEVKGYGNLAYKKKIIDEYAPKKREAISKLRELEKFVDLNLKTEREFLAMKRLQAMKHELRYEFWLLSKNENPSSVFSVPGCLFSQPSSKQPVAAAASNAPSPRFSPGVNDATP